MPQLRVCTKCKIAQPESSFNWKVKFVRRSLHCHNCSRLYIKTHYYNNRSYYILKAKKRNREHKLRLLSVIANHLLNHPCVDCGETNILVLQFDHQNRQEKFDDISHIIRRRMSITRLEAEIAKCDIRCANCHRKKTEIETKSWKLLYAPVA